MDNPLFNEIGVDGSPIYKYGDWKKVAIHNDKEIRGFFGPYRFLSNFEVISHKILDLYPSVENAYQAWKIQPEDRKIFETCSPAESKKVWKNLKRIDKNSSEWDQRKYDVMARFVFEKFATNVNLRKLLMDTGNKYLEELNWWGDKYWGVTLNGVGQNNLGKILMKIRVFWQKESNYSDENFFLETS